MRKVFISKMTIMVCLSLLTVSGLTAQDNDGWKKAKINKNKMDVKYRISKRKDRGGEPLPPRIEFSVTTVEKLDFNRCISLMKDIKKHKEFMDTEESRVIETLSDNEWIIYYLYPGGGPIESADAVMSFEYHRSDDGKTATFILDADPELIPLNDMIRVSEDREVFRFTDLGNGEVEISMDVVTVPAMKVPQWILNLAFPGAAGDVLKNITKIVKKG